MPKPNLARFLSHDNSNIAELQRRLEEYSIQCVGNIHGSSVKLDFSRDLDLFNDDGTPAFTGVAALMCARLVGFGMKNIKQFFADAPPSAHPTVLLVHDPAFSDEGGYRYANEAEAIIFAINSRDEKGNISEQQCFVYFHG
jgi:hypothetical protein